MTLMLKPMCCKASGPKHSMLDRLSAALTKVEAIGVHLAFWCRLVLLIADGCCVGQGNGAVLRGAVQHVALVRRRPTGSRVLHR